MANKDNYAAVAKQIADYLNGFGLAFKTYKLESETFWPRIKLAQFALL